MTLVLRTLIPLLALLPSLASAGPDLAYGVSFERGGRQSELHLERCKGDCFAQVRFTNSYLYGPALARRFLLDLEGLRVTVRVVDGQGMDPEVFSVEPPPGYIAEPAELPVDEGCSAVIAIYPMPMS